MAQPTTVQHDSDSEDDPDYIPPAAGDDSSSDEDESNVQHGQLEPVKSTLTEEEQNAEKKKREALWASFQASISSTSSAKPSEVAKMVKIEKRYRFAGEDIIEVKEVPEDSEDAKSWPLWRPPPESQPPQVPSSSIAATEHREQPSASPEVPVSTEPSTSRAPAGKRPGPRKPKTTLAPLPSSQKPKKLTTLDKSAMDWQSHVGSGVDDGLKDELEANRRGGGYLEKVEFLQRVEERRDSALEANRTTKRRKL